ncbi:MAG: ribosome biosis GTPase / thiamine phosphate phosphatase [Candidatus Petromonas sp.]|jgi:ribosome biogenesis GTPase|nr:ribosome biosis GTPase / thiamine phosphate phosphatase [Candidatus Petromonas sp.]
MSQKGIIVKGIGGFYYVKHNGNVYECRARGRFRNKNITPLVGDYVLFSINASTNEGVIEDIIDRQVELIRPPVANVEQAIIVFAATNPEPNFQLLDKLLIMGEYHNLNLSICINKIDLDIQNISRDIIETYKNTGYKVIFTSVKKQIGMDEIRSVLKDKITVFAGPSGVGKSSILNEVQTGLQLKTGDISSKIKRGKHTTRHTELLKLDFGGWVVDTPGFTSLDIGYIKADELSYFFPEFRNFMYECKFSNCIHVNEPKCKVKEAVENGHININRYNNYVYFINQILENKDRRY